MPPTPSPRQSDETLIKAGEMGLSNRGDSLCAIKQTYSRSERKNDLLKESYFSMPAIRKIRILLLRCTFACNGDEERCS